MNILLYVTIGLAVGSVTGAFGSGGGVLLVPALVWLCGLEPRKATGTSLTILALPVCLPAAFHAFRRGHVDLDAVPWVAGAFVVGALASRTVVDYLPDHSLRMLFGLLMMYISVRFVLSSDSEVANAMAGLVATGIATLAFIGLRLLGRRHLRRPELGEQIRAVAVKGHGEPDYYI
ncbi:MAG: sulfite exporter TauE/SafE family protein [Gemmataceae bacterium]|nr:sulfite exporter TauE/SafE family protein [Gemmataceae bacterium]